MGGLPVTTGVRIVRDLNRNAETNNVTREKARYWINFPCGTGFPVPVDSELHKALEAGVSIEKLLAKWQGTAYIRDCQNAKPKFSYLD